MLNKAFWLAAGERAAKTAAQVALLKFGADTITAGFDVLAADWLGVGSFALGGAVLSVLSSIAFGASDGNPSAGSVERVSE